MSLRVELLELYEQSLKEGTDRLFEVDRKVDVRVGQIREIWCLPPERFVVVEEVQEGLYLTVPLTSYLQLLPQDAPLYELRRTGLRLGVVPVWDYMRKELIERYSTVLGKVHQPELEKIKEYAFSKANEKLDYISRRFVKLNSKRWAIWNMYSLLAQAEIEESSQAQVVRLTPEVEKELERYRAYALAAENRYFRGSNFFAVLKDNLLRLYLPVEFVGKKIQVKVGEVVLFEGELEDVRLEMEGDFSGINLEEGLKVVEL